MIKRKSNIVIDENGEIVARNPIVSTDDSNLDFWDKAKIAVDKALNKLYKIRCICCFTSLFAVLGVLFLFAENINLPQYVEVAIAVFWLVGVLSGLIACPVNFLGIVFKYPVAGLVIGIPFLLVGAVVGFVIGLVIAFALIFFFPAIVTIPFYKSELNFKDRYMD